MLSNNHFSGALINHGSVRRGLPASQCLYPTGEAAPPPPTSFGRPAHEFSLVWDQKTMVPETAPERTQVGCHPTQSHLYLASLRLPMFNQVNLGLWGQNRVNHLPAFSGKCRIPALGNVCLQRTLSCLHCSLFIKHKCQQNLLSQPHEFCKKQNTGKKFYIVFPRCSL